MTITNKQNSFIKVLYITLILSIVAVSFNGCGGGGSSSAVPAQTTSGNTLPNSSGTSSTATGSSTSTTLIGGGGSNSSSVPTAVGYNPDTVTADELPQNTEIPVVLSIF